MALAWSDRIAGRVSAGTRFARVSVMLLLGGLILGVLALLVFLAHRPALRRPLDLTRNAAATPSPQLVARLRALDSKVKVTVFTSEKPPRHLELLQWLAGLDQGRKAIADQEARVRLEALESLRFWLERCALEAPGSLEVEWLDRERRSGAYHQRFSELGLETDLRAARMATLLDARPPIEAPPDEASRARDRFPGLQSLMRRELSAEAIERWNVRDFVDFAVVSCEGRREVIPLDPDWIAIDHSDLLEGGLPRSPRFAGLRVEGALAGALERVLPEGAVHVATLRGQGQDPSRSFPTFLRWLGNRGYTWLDEPVDLLAGDVDPAVDVLIAWNLSRPFALAELSALERFRARGGGLVIAEGARPDFVLSPWDSFLGDLGATFGRGPIARGARGEESEWNAHLLAVRRFLSNHPVVADVAAAGLELWFEEARPLLFGGVVREGGTWEALATIVGEGSTVSGQEALLPWIDLDRDGRRDAEEPTPPVVHLVAVHEPADPGVGRVALMGATTPFEERHLAAHAGFLDALLRFSARRTVLAAPEVRAVEDARFDLFGTLGKNFPAPLDEVARLDAWRILCLYTFPSLIVVLAALTWFVRRRG